MAVVLYERVQRGYRNIGERPIETVKKRFA